MSDDKKYKYHTVNLPENLALKIEEVIDSGKHGYTSVPDFVKSAVRRYLRIRLSLHRSKVVRCTGIVNAVPDQRLVHRMPVLLYGFIWYLVAIESRDWCPDKRLWLRGELGY